MRGVQNDHVRPADEGAFPASSQNSRSNHVRGGKPGIENDLSRRHCAAGLGDQQRSRARMCDGQLIWCNWLKGGECQRSPLLFNLFCFQSEREVPVLWELVIDVAIVSPAPAGTARRGRSVLGRGRLHPGPSTQLCFSFWPGCTWSRTKPIIVKYSMPHTSGVAQKSSNLLNRCCWNWCSWDHWWIHGSPKVTACRTSTEPRIESQKSSSHQAFTVKSATVWEHFSFSQILVFLVIFLTLKHNTSFSWFKNHFVYPLAGVLSMQMQVNH